MARKTEGTIFWLKVNELKNRRLDDDILIAVADGLRGFPEVIEAVIPGADPDLHCALDPQFDDTDGLEVP